MCRYIICMLVILPSFFLGIYSADDDFVEECSLRSGYLGWFVLPIHCEDRAVNEEMNRENRIGRYGPMSKPIMSGDKICCQNISTFTATRACNYYISKRNQGVKTQILEGTSVSEGQFPHMGAIGYRDSEGNVSFLCAGTLISNYYVLTASHCIAITVGSAPHVVRLGVIFLNEPNNNTDYLVKNSIVHPEYNRIQKHNDIGLLLLEREVKFSFTVYPACLGTSKEDPVTIMTITGWGIYQKGSTASSNELLKANLELVGAAECTPFYFRQDWARHNPNGLPTHQMCARGARNNTGADTCMGDSGGPMQELIEKGLSRVLGVVAYGRNCGSNVPGIYTRVSEFVPWIVGIVWRDGFIRPREPSATTTL